ncbi:MAG: purine-nucleoside phosphorylase [Spongiibacteraceae bacterium]|nr:purine-nucleoside phosphorylase [Spongiibacteraceae bacterium]
MTTHINADKQDFSEIVLMPGDPLRAKYIAEKYLTGVKQVSSLRNMLGYTGEYKGQSISVMGSGMGIPSISIYSKELITEYGVKKIIRVGSCGSVSRDAQLREVVIGMGASTDSNVNRTRFNGYDFAALADFELLEHSVAAAREMDLQIRVGNIFSADLFYMPDESMFDVMEKYNIIGVEMEAAGLYGVAAQYGAKALTICTVTDNIRTGDVLSGEDRQTTLDNGIELSLNTAVRAL